MIREYDAKLAVFSGMEPALVQVIDLSMVARAVEDEHGLLCFYGYAADMLGSEAKVWFHAARPLDGYKIAFLRRCRRFIEELQGRYETLYGTVDPESAVACRWLHWLGFWPIDSITVNGKTVNVLAYRREPNGH